MNRLTFIVATYLLLALQNGLTPLWGLGGATPSLLLVLAAFVSTSAPRGTTMGVVLILGLLMDLQPSATRGSGLVIGPHAVGMLLGGYAVLQLRGSLFRESTVTVVLMVLVIGGLSALVETVLYTLRGLRWLAADPIGWSPLQQLGHELRNVGYSALAAIPLGLVLQVSRRWWGFAGRGKSERVF